MRGTSFTLLILMAISAMAQTQKIEILEPAWVECQYIKRTVTDTLDRDNDFRETVMALRIGESISMFYSVPRMQFDSLYYANRDLERRLWHEAAMNKKPSPGGLEKESVYKNYPEGKITMFNQFATMNWRCVEDWQVPEWTLCDSVKVVLEYTCQLATCDYRGRKWHAWFSPEIPVSEGPWKLCGLPGLILEAYDDHNDYHYTAFSLRTEGIDPVGIYSYRGEKWAKIERLKYCQRWWESIHEDVGLKYAMALGWDVDPNRKLPHRNYELQEADYHNK